MNTRSSAEGFRSGSSIEDARMSTEQLTQIINQHGSDFRSLRQELRAHKVEIGEKPPQERESKFMDIDKTRAVPEMLAAGFSIKFDGEVTDHYFELEGEQSPVALFGDWPRIRHKKGSAFNKHTGTMEQIDEYEFSQKGDFTDEGTRPEDSFPPRTTYEEAVKDMHSYFAKRGIAPTQIVFWTEWKKHRTKLKRDNTTIDIDSQKSRTVVFQHDHTLPDGTRIKKGDRRTDDLSSIPTYLEVEVMYPSDAPEAARLAEKERQNVIDDLASRGVLRRENEVYGELDSVLDRYGFRNDGIKPSSEKALRAQKERLATFKKEKETKTVSAEAHSPDSTLEDEFSDVDISKTIQRVSEETPRVTSSTGINLWYLTRRQRRR